MDRNKPVNPGPHVIHLHRMPRCEKLKTCAITCTRAHAYKHATGTRWFASLGFIYTNRLYSFIHAPNTNALLSEIIDADTRAIINGRPSTMRIASSDSVVANQ